MKIEVEIDMNKIEKTIKEITETIATKAVYRAIESITEDVLMDKIKEKMKYFLSVELESLDKGYPAD